MISRGVEISIAGGGGEMVRVEERSFMEARWFVPIPWLLFFLFL